MSCGMDGSFRRPSRAVMTDEPMTEAALFRRVLRLSLNETARALLIASDRNIRRWEDRHAPYRRS